MAEKQTYLVPRAVVTRMEIFPGIGFTELLAVVVGAAVGYMFQLFPALLPIAVGPKLFLRFWFFALPPTAAYLLVRPEVTGITLWQQLMVYRLWRQRPHTYVFRMKFGGE